jgi:soluble lytic murein transglycosylase-like protein
MAMFDYSGPKFDFAPLANLADPIIDQMEKRRAGEELQKYVTAQLGGQSLAGLAPAAAPAAPAAPSMTGGARQAMVMPPEAYAPLIQKAAAEHNIEPDLLTRLLKQESNFNPNALSSAGAMGVAQFMPGTAKRFGIDPTIPEQAIPAAAKYVATNRELFGGNTGLALAGYNWGEGNVRKWMKAGANPNQMPAETRDFVAKITGKPVEGWLTGQNVAAADIPVVNGAPASQFAIPQATARPQPLKSSLVLAKGPPPLAPAFRLSSGRGLWPA